MHSPSALTEHVSLNLAGFFLLDPVHVIDANNTLRDNCTISQREMAFFDPKKETFSRRRFLNSRELPPDCISGRAKSSSSNGSAPSNAHGDGGGGATKRSRM